MDERTLERFPRFSWKDIEKKMTEKTPFEALSQMGTMLIRVKEFRPLIGLAVHAGHRVREELQSKMGIDEDDRRYDEDTCSDSFLADFPIQLIGLDSRYEYDVDRKRDQAVYLKPFQCWGKKIWQTPPTKGELEISYQKYDEAHELIEFFVERSMAHHKKALVLDLHTYSYKRPMFGNKSSTLPVFNVGTTSLDRKKHAKTIDGFLQELRKIRLKGVDISVAENDVFKGDGAVVQSIVSKFPEAGVLVLDVKKVFMDEATGQIHEELAQQLRAALHGILQKLV